MRVPLANDVKRAETIEIGQSIVGENEIEVAAAEVALELCAAVDNHDIEAETGCAQTFLYQLGVERIVFNHQDVVVRGWGVDHRLRNAPGGGSLMTAQKIPRSWMAFMKSLNATGFTTYALLPKSYPADTSLSSRDDVRMTTGRLAMFGSSRMICSSSRPSILGSLRSRRTTVGRPGSLSL